jgi:hypothetical protein
MGWVVREGLGGGGEMTQVLYAHMNNKKKKNSNLISTVKKKFPPFLYSSFLQM